MQANPQEKEELEIIETDATEEVIEEQQEAAAPEADNDDGELEQYSESVQKRISKLTHRYREEERQRQAAIEYAEAVKKQNDELKSRLDLF